MAAHKIDIAAELVAQGKRLYENTQTSVRDIAAMMGISKSTLNNRALEWKWRRRQTPGGTIDLVRMVRGAVAAEVTDPAAADAAAPADARPVTPISPERRAALAERIQAVAEREMAVVEKVVAILGPADEAEAERTTRTLAGIARTLREITALNKPAGEVKDADDDDTADATIPRDMEEFRRELARRLHAIIDAQSGTEDSRDRGSVCEPDPRRAGSLPR